ncbi:hypothetical protein Micbo1qcDRAFT_222672 [Microdochium bolleyi]|uniref:Uncharacterized protein n=1 Tax=Microdochium bolleyi TaxID=196109 RepID=A0A136J706_9PEZI|nr:hypothetical protein Micbo1qcDRAFT_222672 [Microdochium bolleyi]
MTPSNEQEAAAEALHWNASAAQVDGVLALLETPNQAPGCTHVNHWVVVVTCAVHKSVIHLHEVPVLRVVPGLPILAVASARRGCGRLPRIATVTELGPSTSLLDQGQAGVPCPPQGSRHSCLRRHAVLKVCCMQPAAPSRKPAFEIQLVKLNHSLSHNMANPMARFLALPWCGTRILQLKKVLVIFLDCGALLYQLACAHDGSLSTTTTLEP